MRPTRAIPATLVALAIAAPAADARPTIRVETVSRELVPALTSGSVRSYVDTDGALHALPARSALGQVVAVGARLDVPVDIQFFSSFASGLLQRFGSGRSATGGWQFTVDGVPPQVGADSTVLPSNAEVVWWLVDDFATQGGLVPLDLDLVSKSAHGVVRFRVTRFDSATGKVKGAAGATLRVAGRSRKVPASGVVTVRLKRGTRFHARATAPNSIRSDRVSGKV
jgi:hypothetical protein